jgi:hypothetical protein
MKVYECADERFARQRTFERRNITVRTNELIQATRRGLFLLMVLFLFASAAAAQTTEFTYPGKLADGGSPANGSYDLIFDRALRRHHLLLCRARKRRVFRRESS